MARPIEFNKTIALEAAVEAFWTNGYERTSLQDLVDSMDLSKSSFYNAYGSKHNLFADALLSYSTMMAASLRQRLEAAGSGIGFIEELLSEIVATSTEDSARRGCFLMNTASELAQSDCEISKITKTGFRQFQSVFRDAVARAIEEGEISPDKNPDRVAWFILNGIVGLKSLVKAGIDKENLAQIQGIILNSLR